MLNNEKTKSKHKFTIRWYFPLSGSSYNTKTMETEPSKKTIQLAEVLLIRLEKISADSAWAHQASGVRASIAKILAREEIRSGSSTLQVLEDLIRLGFEILESVAGEIPDE